MDLKDVGSLGLQALGFGGDIFQGFYQNKLSKEAIAVQQQENQKNRDFSREMYNLAQQNALDQWNRENVYNDPSNVIKRLKMAGINPDLYYSGGASAPSATASMPSNPSGSGSITPTSVPMQDFTAKSLSVARAQAEIDNIKADTHMKQGQGDIFASDAAFRDAWNQGQLDTQYLNIRIGNKDIDLKDTQIAEIRKNMQKVDEEMKVLNETVDNLRAHTANLDVDTLIKQIRSFYESDICQASIRELTAKADLTEKEASMYVQTALASIAQMDAIALFNTNSANYVKGAQTDYTNSQKRVSDLEGNRIVFQDFRLKMQYEDDSNFYSTGYGFERKMKNFYRKCGTTVRVLDDMVGGFVSKITPIVSYSKHAK